MDFSSYGDLTLVVDRIQEPTSYNRADWVCLVLAVVGLNNTKNLLLNHANNESQQQRTLSLTMLYLQYGILRHKT
jgi:hypothetical protein